MNDFQLDNLIKRIEDPDDSESAWRSCRPQMVLDELHKMKNPTDESKPLIAASYKKWSGMNITQKRKAVKAYQSLSDALRSRVVESAMQSLRVAETAEFERLRQTNKHDRCRLLHISVDDRLRRDWDMTTQQMTRAQLDDGGEDINPWAEIAAAYNNRDDYVYNNVAVSLRGVGTANSRVVPS